MAGLLNRLKGRTKRLIDFIYEGSKDHALGELEKVRRILDNVEKELSHHK